MSVDLTASSERWVRKIQEYLAGDEPAIKKMKVVHKFSALFADAVIRAMPEIEGHQSTCAHTMSQGTVSLFGWY